MKTLPLEELVGKPQIVRHPKRLKKLSKVYGIQSKKVKFEYIKNLVDIRVFATVYPLILMVLKGNYFPTPRNRKKIQKSL